MKNSLRNQTFFNTFVEPIFCKMRSYKNKHSYIQVHLTIRTRYVQLRVRSFISLRRILLFV